MLPGYRLFCETLLRTQSLEVYDRATPESHYAVSLILAYVIVEKPLEAWLAKHPVIRRSGHTTSSPVVSLEERRHKQQTLSLQLLFLLLLS